MSFEIQQLNKTAMKISLTTLISLILSFFVFGNDGVYLSHGSAIYPIKESKISIEKEVLSFSVRNNTCQVDILFEFNNPVSVERKLLIGFQAPTAAGDVSEKISNTIQINNFQITANGQAIPYQIKAAACEDCELKEPNNFRFSQFDPGVFVFLFEVNFKPGMNSIKHSYNFPASSNIAFDQFYNYILTTGAKWSGGTIKHLTVNFDLGNNTYFFVQDIFGKHAEWSIAGNGKITTQKFEFDSNINKMVRIISGKLKIEVKNHKPLKNIVFGIICNDSFITIPTDNDKLISGKVFSIRGLSLDSEKTYNKETLRILRNTVYAQHGYAFRSPDLKKYFSQFAWYIPDPNMSLNMIHLSFREHRFINEILVREKKEHQ